MEHKLAIGCILNISKIWYDRQQFAKIIAYNLKKGTFRAKQAMENYILFNPQTFTM